MGKASMFRVLAGWLLGAGLLVGAMPVAAEAGEVQFPPSSQVGLAPPEGFSVAKDFTGFFRQELGASILFAAFPGEAFDQMVRAVKVGGLAEQGIIVQGECEGVTLSVEGICRRGYQLAQSNIRVEKWVVVGQFGDITALVSANVPTRAIEGGEVTEADIADALSTLTTAD